MFDLKDIVELKKRVVEVPDIQGNEPDGILKVCDSHLMLIEQIVYDLRVRLWDINYSRVQERMKTTRPVAPKSRPITTIDDLMS